MSSRSWSHLATQLGLALLLTPAFVLAAQQGAEQDQPAQAQQPQPEPQQPAPAVTQPAAPEEEGRTPITFRVIEVNGDVKHAPLDSTEWQAVELNDEYTEGTKVLTGVRSSVKLQIGEQEPYACLLVDSVGLTLLNEAAIVGNTKRMGVGVGFGRVKAGVAEGGLESEFTVSSPVATLSKRGTWGFFLFYERDTDLFEIGLTTRGLIEAINDLTAQSRTLAPGQVITQAMRRWLDESELRRNVAVSDILGQEDYAVAFNRLRNDGLGVINPGQGYEPIINLQNSQVRADFARRAERLVGVIPIAGIDVINRNRPEGFFGTGRGEDLVEFLVRTGDPLVKQGAARPGRYLIRRDALANWLREYKSNR